MHKVEDYTLCILAKMFSFDSSAENVFARGQRIYLVNKWSEN